MSPRSPSLPAVAALPRAHGADRRADHLVRAALVDHDLVMVAAARAHAEHHVHLARVRGPNVEGVAVRPGRGPDDAARVIEQQQEAGLDVALARQQLEGVRGHLCGAGLVPGRVGVRGDPHERAAQQRLAGDEIGHRGRGAAQPFLVREIALEVPEHVVAAALHAGLVAHHDSAAGDEQHGQRHTAGQELVEHRDAQRSSFHQLASRWKTRT